MRRQTQLTVFILVSVTAHLIFVLLLTAFNNAREIPISVVNDHAPLQISMIAPHQITDNLSRQTIKPENKAENSKSDRAANKSSNLPPLKSKRLDNPQLQISTLKSTTDSISAEKNKTQQNIETDEIQNTTDRLERKKSTAISSLESRSTMIRNRLNALIAENFKYPGFAVRRGWQGTVELGLRIEANGRLSNVHIVKTSGYSILDQAAITTLAKTSYIDGIQTWLAGDPFDTTLPVKYQLIDG